MTEAILIEIAQRFRKLEDAVESADIYHAERVERVKEEIRKMEEARYDLETALERCREDMAAMQEQIRRRV